MVREELETLMHREEIMWAQKGRHNWVIYGDRNTRYFQTVVKQRARNRIVQLKSEVGELITEQKGIEELLFLHFKQNFEGKTEVTIDQLMALNKPVTLAEIETTIFQIRPYKAPGPDGILAFFYQEYWDIMKHDIFNTVLAFFHSGS